MNTVTKLGLHPTPADLEGAEPIYAAHRVQGSLHPPPDYLTPSFKHDGTRKAILHEWGQKRELHMHRAPAWCMDQLVSGSGLYPPRHLANEWFTEDELVMVQSLERQLQATNHAQVLAKDMMALKLYGVDVNIVIDDSYSMTESMFGKSERIGRDWSQRLIRQVFGQRAFSPDSPEVFENTGCRRLAAGDRRWDFQVDALDQWKPIFDIMGVQPNYYTLNRHERFKSPFQALCRGPCGQTPSGTAFLRVLGDIEAGDPNHTNPHLIIFLTDGEASDSALFNSVLDSIQDGAYGDVQVLLMGLSLEPRDLKFFEAEECDDTRIRTIEAYEVEQQTILWREMIQQPSDYNFAMHSMRALLTNLFPGDYDYEAPIQTFRHRLYITLHAIDRRITGCRDNTYLDSRHRWKSLLPWSQPAEEVPCEEADLVKVLCDPRIESLVQKLRPPPRKAKYYATTGGKYMYATQSTRQLCKAIAALQQSPYATPRSLDMQYYKTEKNLLAVRRTAELMCKAIGEAGLIEDAMADQPSAAEVSDNVTTVVSSGHRASIHHNAPCGVIGCSCTHYHRATDHHCTRCTCGHKRDAHGVPEVDLTSIVFPSLWKNQIVMSRFNELVPVSGHVLASLQQLLNRTYSKTWTRDRKKHQPSDQVPKGFQVTAAFRNEQLQSWTRYVSRRHSMIADCEQTPNVQYTDVQSNAWQSLAPAGAGQLAQQCNEWYLFHGANDHVARSICSTDFHIDMAGQHTGTLYGKGAYLAESITKADEYTQPNGHGDYTVILCRTLGGRVCYNSEVTPDPEKMTRACTDGPYGCVLGDRAKCRGTFREFVFFESDHVYPEYIIHYKRL